MAISGTFMVKVPFFDRLVSSGSSRRRCEQPPALGPRRGAPELLSAVQGEISHMSH